MKRVKIIGAGSIGNHLSQAARSRGWDVVLCDKDPEALKRTKNSIYPQRYGSWDHRITLSHVDEAPIGGFDYIFIGTPPDSHVKLAEQALDENPRAVLVEKPFGTPDLTGFQEFFEKARAKNIPVFVGYDHAVAASVFEMRNRLSAGGLGEISTIDAAFREHWQGIFSAHPWLDGPKDSYLGYWRRGGGACGEHSHAIHLWQSLAHASGAGRVVEVSAVLDYVRNGEVAYDRIACMNLKTESGLVGRVVQDVVTKPPLKWVYVQGEAGAIEWRCWPKPYADTLSLLGENDEQQRFDKTRPDDFKQELDHMEAVMDSGDESPISIERGLETMMVIAAAHQSADAKKTVTIDYGKGYIPAALSS